MHAKHSQLMIASLLLLGLGARLAFAAPDPGLGPDGPAAIAAATPTSACVLGLDKQADPLLLLLGQTSQATLVITGTCGAQLPPVDLVIVADESNSMARGRPGGGSIDNTPTPVNPGPGTVVPGPTSDLGKPGDEPAFCSRNDTGNIPTPTPTPRRFRTPTPDLRPDPTEPAEELGEADLIRDVQSLVRDLLDQEVVQRDLASDRLRIGFVSFGEKARIKQTLTNQSSKILTALSRMTSTDLTYISSGMREAERMLSGTGSRSELGEDDRIQVIMILSDFQFCQRDMRSGGGAGSDIEVLTVGFGRDLNRKNMIDLASDRGYAFEGRDLRDILEVYEQQLAPPRPVTLDRLAVLDALDPRMALLPDSDQPPASDITGQQLTWLLDKPQLPLTLTFAVEPLEAGHLPISARAGITWTDSIGLAGSGLFPAVELEVLALTPTPTATWTPSATPTATATPTDTPTATATATPTPSPAYLPFLVRVWPEPLPTPTKCIPEEQTIDVALVIDSSVSMGDPTRPGGQAKLDAAIEAAIEIVALLKESDQATVVGFNAEARVMAELTGDKAALDAALRALPTTQAAGTAIDSGLRAALAELDGPRHRPANHRSIILVTDGAQSGGEVQKVRDAADAAKAAGIRIVTVGLGPDADTALLTEVASEPSLFFAAPDAEDLVRIYREVARLIPCP